jgi:large subunit ribosomal protein L35
MPKMKTHKGAKKRFSVTATGKVRRLKAYKSHILTKKTPKRKRNLRRAAIVKRNGEARTIKRLLQA